MQATPCCAVQPGGTGYLGQVRNWWGSSRPKTRYGLTLEAFVGARGIPKEGPFDWPGAGPIQRAGRPDNDTGARGFGRYWELHMDNCPDWRTGTPAVECWARSFHEAVSYFNPPLMRGEWNRFVDVLRAHRDISAYPPLYFSDEVPGPALGPTPPPLPGLPPAVPPPTDPTIPPLEVPIAAGFGGSNLLVFGGLLLLAMYAGPKLQKMIR